jgi:hypothetical protein
MPPVVAILASVVVLLVALAVLLPPESADSREELPQPGASESSSPDPEEAAALARAERLEMARDIWLKASRTHVQAKLVFALGFTGIVGAGCAYAGVQAALEQDWANAIVLFIASIMLEWGAKLSWSRLQTLRH